MGARKKPNEQDLPIRGRPATTPEARENQLIARAVDLAEKQMIEGTASAQVITHYLKLGTARERLEQRRIEQEILLAEAKVESLKSAGEVQELYKRALEAMNSYTGKDVRDSVDEFFD